MNIALHSPFVISKFVMLTLTDEWQSVNRVNGILGGRVNGMLEPNEWQSS